jgi:signal peptidase II
LTFYLWCLAVVALDQGSKWWMTHHGSDRALLGDVLRLTLTQNTGAAFGLFQGARGMFVAVGLAAAAGLLFANYVLPPHDKRRVMLALILGGNLGNLVDRARSGRVTDFIDMGIGSARWPVYNVADIAVVCGAAGLAWLLLRDGKPARVAAAPADAVAPAEGTSTDAR